MPPGELKHKYTIFSVWARLSVKNGDRKENADVCWRRKNGKNQIETNKNVLIENKWHSTVVYNDNTTKKIHGVDPTCGMSGWQI